MNFRPTRTEALSAKELYLFDTTGVLRLPAFLSQESVAECLAEVRKLPERPMEGRGDKIRFDDLASNSTHFKTLAASPEITSCVEPLINQPYRLIESYALRHEPTSTFYLHNGMSEILHYGRDRIVKRNLSFNHSFHDGKLFCMFIKVLLYLTDVAAEEDGPFCYLEGSHKANFAWFDESEAETKPPLTKANFPSLQAITIRAGDALIINEALLHGTLAKTSEQLRIVMAFSYAPAFVTDWKEIDLTRDDPGQLGHY